MAYLLKKKSFSNGRTDKRTDGWSDYIMPQILFGGIKTNELKNTSRQNHQYIQVFYYYLWNHETNVHHVNVYITMKVLHENITT